MIRAFAIALREAVRAYRYGGPEQCGRLVESGEFRVRVQDDAPNERPANIVRILALIVCLFSTMLYSVRVYADFCARAGDFLVASGEPVRGMAYLGRSVRLAPESIRYRTMYVNCAKDLASIHPNPKAREFAVSDMMRVAMSGVRGRPHDSDSHYILAFASWAAYHVTRNERYRILAESEARKSLEMAPEFEPVKDLLRSVQ